MNQHLADPMHCISAVEEITGLGAESPMVITPMALAPTLSRAAINQGMMNAAQSDDTVVDLSDNSSAMVHKSLNLAEQRREPASIIAL